MCVGVWVWVGVGVGESAKVVALAMGMGQGSLRTTPHTPPGNDDPSRRPASARKEACAV